MSFIPKSHWSKKKTETPNKTSQIRLGACRPSRALQCGITFTFPVPEGTLFSPYILLEKTTTVQQIQQWQFTLFRRECVSDRQPPRACTCFPCFPGYDCESQRLAAVTTHPSVPVFILVEERRRGRLLLLLSVRGRSISIALQVQGRWRGLPPGQVVKLMVKLIYVYAMNW